jgi:hypothetical protein
MRTALQRPRCGPVWAQRIAVLAALIGLAGCGTYGDFQEVSPSASRADMHDWLSLDAIAGKPTWPSDFPLTEDERALRDLAYPLIEWPYNRHKFYSVAGEYGVIGADHRTNFDVTGYTTHLFGDERRTASSRYGVLTDDIRNDTTRLPQFFETASRVLDIDSKRRKSLFYVSSLSERERTNALRRVDENASIVVMVRRSLDERVAAYKFALERLVVMTPNPQAVQVEHALNELRAKVAWYRTHLPPGWTREQSLASAR